MRTQSNEIGKIVEALSKAQIAFEPIIKDVSSHHGKYAPLDVCYTSTRKALCDNNLTVTQSDVIYDGRNILETTLAHISGEFFKGYTDLTQLLANARGSNPLHEWGKIKTYTRRYGYLLIIGAIGENEDNDGADSQTKNNNVNKVKTKIEAHPLTTQLINLIKNSGCDIQEFTKFYNVSSKDLVHVKATIDNFDDLLINFKDSNRKNDGKEIDK